MADIEISEAESEEQYGGGSFKDEFMDKVSVNTIMSGATSIGRNEARLMLCQLRSVALQQVNLNDPGVLMLDGLPISELETFLDSAEGMIIDALKGDGADSSDEEEMIAPSSGGGIMIAGGDGGDGGGGGESDDEKGAFNDPNKRTTLPQLATVLDNFQHAETTNQRSKYRNDFFTCFNNLDAVHRLQIPTDVRSMIESALTLGASNQETILLEVKLPEGAVQRMSVGDRGGNNAGGLGYGGPMNMNMTPGDTGGTTTGLYGEIGLSSGQGTMHSSAARKLAEMESKNLLDWLKHNKSSSHVWFFVVGFTMTVTFFLQIWIDFAFGDMWRAILMELLTLTGVLICILEADTPFIRTNIQSRFYSYYQFLSKIEGRTIFYAFVSFCAFGQFKLIDIMAIIGGMSLLTLTVIRGALYSYSDKKLDNMVLPLIDSTNMRDTFDEHDVDHDGYLKLADLDALVGTIPLFTRFLHEVIFWRMDAATNDGQIDVHEFVQFCSKYKKEMEKRVKFTQERQSIGIVSQHQSVNLGMGLQGMQSHSQNSPEVR